MLTIIIHLLIIGGLGVLFHIFNRPSLVILFLALTALVTNIFLVKWYYTDDYVEWLCWNTIRYDEDTPEQLREWLSNNRKSVSLVPVRENKDGTTNYTFKVREGIVYDCTLSSNRNKLTSYVKR